MLTSWTSLAPRARLAAAAIATATLAFAAGGGPTPAAAAAAASARPDASTPNAVGDTVGLTALSLTLYPPPTAYGWIRHGILQVRNDSPVPVTRVEYAIDYYDSSGALLSTADLFGSLADILNPGESAPVDLIPPNAAATGVVEAVAGVQADHLGNRNFLTGPVTFTAPDSEGYTYAHIPVINLNRDPAQITSAAVLCANGYAFETFEVPAVTVAAGAAATLYAVHAGPSIEPPCDAAVGAIVNSPTPATAPLTAPAPPTAVQAVGGAGSATIAWSPSTDGGGLPVTSYTATASDTDQSCTSTGASCTVTGLINGQRYTFTVTSTTTLGPGPASQPSDAVLVSTTPSRPRTVTATAGKSAARVRWLRPTTTGGSPVTEYRVTSTPGGHTCTTTTATTCVVHGLVRRHTYRFTVAARNSRGTSPPAARSNAVRIR